MVKQPDKYPQHLSDYPIDSGNSRLHSKLGAIPL